MKRAVGIILFVGVAAGAAWSAGIVEKFTVHETLSLIWVRTHAVAPDEVKEETQAKALCRDGAIALGQEELLAHVLKKKTHSGKTLADAQIPNIELQNKVHGMIQGAEVKSTTWADKDCYVTLSLPKSRVGAILKRN